MRINNPRAFTAYSDSQVNSSSYSLATVGQLEQKVKELEDNFKLILTGNKEAQGGAGGLNEMRRLCLA